ncbi:hypothetical protein CIT292_08491 [Citrobacter youngae ATCC 29220]|uniref:Uncharacterized protein n=1 Tax=Citrobacter youngae ATCC 29220 TaxID=500640 RepID=D4BDC4_9ENTR|nr:hypothetical protein CIT292_08491 [Citrobacter youngae ATCC 29220]
MHIQACFDCSAKSHFYTDRTIKNHSHIFNKINCASPGSAIAFCPSSEVLK